MITTRITAGAFLTCGNKVLLMKRGLQKKLAPGQWAGIGGHLDLADITDPRAINPIETCYREIFEEVGIHRSAIINLRLRYIAVRLVDGEIRNHYKFFGELAHEIPLPYCNEGELHWVEREAVGDLSMTVSVKNIYEHWMNHPHNEEIFVVAIKDGITGTVIRL
jgi:8-oxo-dGTP diphosphatase